MIKKFLLISLVLHLILIGVSLKKETKVYPKKEQKKIKVKISKKGSNKFIEKYGKEPCTKYYYGVGIKYYLLGEVANIAPESPAEKIGIQIGDVILNTSDLHFDKNDESNLNRILKLRINRNGITLDFNLTIQKICVESQK